jgi:DNA-binding response OmpR family regulator
MRKILLIDDDKLWADPLIFLVRESHLNIHWEATGSNGLDFLEKNHNDIDLLLLDMKLPDINGKEIQRKVLQHYPFIPIVIITSEKLSEIDEAIGLELGAVEYYDKSKGIKILLIKIRKILQRNQSRQKKNQSKHILTYNKDTEQFSFDEQLLDLPGKHLNVLLSLYKRPSQIVTYELIRLEANLAPTAEIKGYIKGIRGALKTAGLSQPKNLIKTEFRRGYRYTP